MDVHEHVQLVGKHMVQVVVNGLRSGKLAVDRTREIARFYLNVLHTASTEAELTENLALMDEQLPEMHEVVQMDSLRNKEIREKAMKQEIETLLQDGRVEEAAQLAKGVMQ